MIYTVQQGETIGDVIQNSVGSISFWNDVLNANPSLTQWVPILTAGQQIIIPDTIVRNLNNVRQFASYPLNNASVPTVYTQIATIFALIT